METHLGTSSVAARRQSNLELYRIIVMLLIVAHHYVVNSGVIDLLLADPSAPRSIYYLLLGAWGKIGINCFVCITAWFMCKSRISAQKFLKLLVQVYFYRILFFVMCWLL